jgi:hypothetical protein
MNFMQGVILDFETTGRCLEQDSTSGSLPLLLIFAPAVN